MTEEEDAEFYGTATAKEEALILAPPPVDPVKQARTDAVAALLKGAYEKASTLALTPEEIKALREPFPDEQVSDGAKGKPGLLYIQHIHLSNRLNDVLGIGQWSIVKRSVQVDESNGAVYFDGVMLIRGAFVWEAIGAARYQAGNRMTDYSDAVESAQSDCLTRCCKRLGIGSQVWDKAFCDGWLARRNSAKRKPKPDPDDEPPVMDPHIKFKQMMQAECLRVGREAYFGLLNANKFESAAQITDRNTQKAILEMLAAMPPKEN